MEPAALTSLILLDYTVGGVYLRPVYVSEMRSSFMQVKSVATEQCSVSVYKLFVFVHAHLVNSLASRLFWTQGE